ncbi:MAG: RNA methyltransferase [Balneolaceae bacterium]
MKKRSTRDILDQNLQRTSPLQNRVSCWLHNIRSLHNVGAAFRCCDAFGVQHLYLSGYTPLPPRPEITKTAIGAEEHVAWTAVEHVEAQVQTFKKKGVMLAGLEQTHSSIPLHEYSLPEKAQVCIILGNEVRGIEEPILSHLDVAVEIPQFGMKHSLNVSVACGVALYALFQKLAG